MVTRDVELGTSGYGSHGRRMRGSPVLIYTWMDSDGYDIYIYVYICIMKYLLDFHSWVDLIGLS